MYSPVRHLMAEQENGRRWLFGQPRFAEQVVLLMNSSGVKPVMQFFFRPQTQLLSSESRNCKLSHSGSRNRNATNRCPGVNRAPDIINPALISLKIVQ